eukprot:scaffold266_cov391-Prasinococcus_capsulatus_cf.AAC.35
MDSLLEQREAIVRRGTTYADVTRRTRPSSPLDQADLGAATMEERRAYCASTGCGASKAPSVALPVSEGC